MEVWGHAEPSRGSWAALLAEDNAIAMLPQPFVTTAQMKSDRIQVRLDLAAVYVEIGNIEALLASL